MVLKARTSLLTFFLRLKKIIELDILRDSISSALLLTYIDHTFLVPTDNISSPFGTTFNVHLSLVSSSILPQLRVNRGVYLLISFGSSTGLAKIFIVIIAYGE